jgi:pyruvate ferredoxin oxidoreductase gamma subunit
MADKTVEIRWHGRGGQGAVTSAELLALAAIEEGKYGQAMPSFGPERRGAPVLAYNRVNASNPIRTRAPVNEPDVVVVLDPGLLDVVDVTAGIKKDGIIVVNSPKSLDELKKYFKGEWTLAAVDATSIARETIGVPIVNTTMLGALIKATDVIKLHSLGEPLKERFGGKSKNNLESATKAFEKTVTTKTSPAGEKIAVHVTVEKLPGWKAVKPGAIITEKGNAKEYKTGDWKSAKPVYDNSKCTKCGLCFVYCPEGCIRPLADGFFEPNLYYCKGCGICAKECPKDVITMVEV